jgi:hypothetical protein
VCRREKLSRGVAVAPAENCLCGLVACRKEGICVGVEVQCNVEIRSSDARCSLDTSRGCLRTGLRSATGVFAEWSSEVDVRLFAELAVAGEEHHRAIVLYL